MLCKNLSEIVSIEFFCQDLQPCTADTPHSSSIMVHPSPTSLHASCKSSSDHCLNSAAWAE